MAGKPENTVTMLGSGRDQQCPRDDSLAGAQPLQQQAWQAAMDLYRDENCRFFRVADILPVYGCLCDYALGRGMDFRSRRLAERHLAVLTETARRVEADAVAALPDSWQRAKQALAAAIGVFSQITAGQQSGRP
jgi:hypothetical protein